MHNQTVKELKNTKQKLDFLCLHFDPFHSEPSEEIKQLIQEFELENYLDDPFSFTNQVLQLLDEAETNIKAQIQ